MTNNIKIGVLHYLPEESYLKNDSLLPIQLGFFETGVDMGIQKDNTGDNRSDRHPIYSEYSGIYWIWKNVHTPYKGIFQHRRSLASHDITSSYLCDYIIMKLKVGLKNIIKCSRGEWRPVVECKSHLEYVDALNKTLTCIPKIFEQGYDIIAPSPYHFINYNVLEQFDEVVNRGLMTHIKSILASSYNPYYELFLQSLNDNRMYYANISVMREALFDEYCTFVFGVFDALETKLISERYYFDICKEKSMYRIFGYIGELLTNVYIRKKQKQGCKVKELCLLYDSSVKGNEDTDYTKILL